MARLNYLYIALSVILLGITSLTFTSCQDDGDDIEEIFQGNGNDKTWYVTGAKINGYNINGQDVKQFYSNPYYLKFTNNSISGELENGSHLTGYWRADGESKTVEITIKSYTEGNATPLSKKVYDILRKATHYSGDANILYLKQDDYNYIMLNTRRE